ncbi:unnamed protein product [Paramecium sonneborni]|uniref:Uncharacterized protein n=1 Tax=Paramecium sonneborni TaxID=65129 RepID=A0A8S1QDS7_9CILI|nr:unnamed protein product [Paramecium sonneborni]
MPNKISIQSFSKFAQTRQQIFLLYFDILANNIQNIYGSYLNYKHSLYEFFMADIYVIVQLKIIRTLVKLYKRKEQLSQYYVQSYLFNLDVILSTFHYYL